MISKRQRKQQNVAKVASNKVFKKRGLEARLFSKLAQPKIDDNKLNMVNTSNTKDRLKTWFWYRSVNKTNSDTKEEKNNIAKSDLDFEELR